MLKTGNKNKTNKIKKQKYAQLFGWMHSLNISSICDLVFFYQSQWFANIH